MGLLRWSTYDFRIFKHLPSLWSAMQPLSLQCSADASAFGCIVKAILAQISQYGENASSETLGELVPDMTKEETGATCPGCAEITLHSVLLMQRDCF